MCLPILIAFADFAFCFSNSRCAARVNFRHAIALRCYDLQQQFCGPSSVIESRSSHSAIQKLTPTTEARRRGENRKGKRELRRFIIRESAAPQGAADSSPARSRGERQRAEGQVPGKGSIHELHTAVGRSAAKGGALQKERPASLVFNARVGPLSIIRSP
jgi:hypothetical protein